jgi:hypothetical protein
LAWRYWWEREREEKPRGMDEEIVGGRTPSWVDNSINLMIV